MDFKIYNEGESVRYHSELEQYYSVYIQLVSHGAGVKVIAVDSDGQQHRSGNLFKFRSMGCIERYPSINGGLGLDLDYRDRIVTTNVTEGRHSNHGCGTIPNKSEIEDSIVGIKACETPNGVSIRIVDDDGCVMGGGYVLTLTRHGKINRSESVSRDFGFQQDRLGRVILCEER